MDARQRHSYSPPKKLYDGTGSLPLSAHPESSKQHSCSADYNVQQNIRID